MDDRNYYARRAEEQKAAASRARDAAVRDRHLELARLLAARQAKSPPPTRASIAP